MLEFYLPLYVPDILYIYWRSETLIRIHFLFLKGLWQAIGDNLGSWPRCHSNLKYPPYPEWCSHSLSSFSSGSHWLQILFKFIFCIWLEFNSMLHSNSAAVPIFYFDLFVYHRRMAGILRAKLSLLPFLLKKKNQVILFHLHWNTWKCFKRNSS